MGKTYFISGHREITQEEFDKHYKWLIESYIDLSRVTGNKTSFVVGDYWGVDEMAQDLLAKHIEQNSFIDVTVYHMFDKPRVYKSDKFKTKGGYKTDEERDAAMTNESTADIAYLKPNKRNSGTAQNIIRRFEIIK